MDAVIQVIEQAEQRCRDNGLRFTDKRKLVLTLLLQAGKAMSAYELVDAYKHEFGTTIPAMSMYRILEFLMEEGFVHRLELANKYVACEHINCKREQAQVQFLICEECKKVKEIHISGAVMDELKKKITDTGYQLVSSQLEMSCICVDCSTNPT